MGRTQLTPRRLSETKKTNIGRIIIFCEGKTEKYYFDSGSYSSRDYEGIGEIWNNTADKPFTEELLMYTKSRRTTDKTCHGSTSAFSVCQRIR